MSADKTAYTNKEKEAYQKGRESVIEDIDEFIEVNQLTYNMGNDWVILVKSNEKDFGLDKLKKIIKNNNLRDEQADNHSPSQQTSVDKREVVHTKETSDVGENPTLDINNFLTKRIKSCYISLLFFKDKRKDKPYWIESYRSRLDELILIYRKLNNISFIEACKQLKINYEDVDIHSPMEQRDNDKEKCIHSSREVADNGRINYSTSQSDGFDTHSVPADTHSPQTKPLSVGVTASQINNANEDKTVDSRKGKEEK